MTELRPFELPMEFARVLRDFSEWVDRLRAPLEATLSQEERVLYNAMIADDAPWLDSLVKATKDRKYPVDEVADDE